MADDYLPPVVAEILLRTEGFEQGTAKVRSEMSSTAATLDAEADKASQSTAKLGVSAQQAADATSRANLKIVTSARQAGEAARVEALSMGKSAEEAAAAAGKAAESFTVAQSKMTAAQKAAGLAAAEAAAAAKKSADEQELAYARAAAAAEVEGEKISQSQRFLGQSLNNAGIAMGGALGRPLRGFGRQIEDTEHKARSFTGTLSEIGKVVTYGGILGFVGAAYEGVKAAQAYQTSIAQIAADSGQRNAGQIGQAFLGTMGKSAFSATELASSYAQVSQQLKVVEGSTLSAAQAMKVMNASSDLAKGAQTDLGSATQAVAQVMQGYHLSVNQASTAADTLYSTARATNSSVGDIATSMGRLHSRLGALTPSLKDVSGMMVGVAQTGLTGSRGILQVSSAIQHLLGGSTTVDDQLAHMHVTLTNASGGFVGMQSAISQLHRAFQSYGPAQQNVIAGLLFGTGAAQTMAQVIDKGTASFQRDAQAADRSGSAHAAAAAQSKTLADQLEVMKATVDDISVAFGQIMIPVLEKVMSTVSSVVGWFAKNKSAAIALATVISGVLGAAVAVFAYGKLKDLGTGLKEIGKDFIEGVTKVKTWASSLVTSQPEIEGVSAASGDATAEVTGLGVAATETGAKITGLGVETDAAGAQLALFGGETETAGGQLALFQADAESLVGTLQAVGDQAAVTGGQIAAMSEEGAAGMGLMSRLGIAGAAAGLGFMLTGGTSGWSTSRAGKTGTAGTLSQLVIGGGTHTSNNLGDVLGEWNPFGSHFNKTVQVPNERRWTVSKLAELQKGLGSVTSASQLSTEQLKKFSAITQQILAAGDITSKQRAGLKELATEINPKAVAQLKQTQAELMKLKQLGASPGTSQAAMNEANKVISHYQMAANNTGVVPLEQTLGIRMTGSLRSQLHSAIVAGRPTTGILAGAEGGKQQAGYEREISQMHKQGLDSLIPKLVAAHKAALDALSQQLVAQQALKDSTSLTLEATSLTDQTKAAQDAANTEVSVIKDQQAIVSDAMQASAKNISDAASVMSARMSAAATQISDASQVGQDRSAAIVQSMSDATQVQADILGERSLYGYQLVAQRLQVQLDATKEGFDKQIAISQEHLDEDKQHWDGRIAAAQINVARVTQHEDQLVAIAQQREAITQERADTQLGNAQQRSDTAQLAADMRTAIAQNAVTLSQSATPAQKQAAENMLTLAQSQSNVQTSQAAASLESVTASTQKATNLAAGAYQKAQDQAATREAKAQTLLTKIQGQAQINEAKDQQKLDKLNETMNKVVQKLQDQITLAQQGGGRRIRSDATNLAGGFGTFGGTGRGKWAVVNNSGPALTGPGIAAYETTQERRMGKGNFTINGGVHIHGAGQTNEQVATQMALKFRNLMTSPG